MPAKRILFEPWAIAQMKFIGFKESAGAEYLDKNARWTAHIRKKYVVDGGTTVTAENLRAVISVFYTETGVGSIMSRLGDDDQVYVRGHCLPGLDCIFSKDSYLQVHQTTDLIVRDAMRTVDSTIKVGASCLKADEVVRRIARMGLPVGFRGAVKCYNCHSAEGDPSFAQTFADAMYDKGYTKCTFYGYKGALDSFHQAADGRKHSTHDGKRASENRYVITPSKLQKT